MKINLIRLTFEAGPETCLKGLTKGGQKTSTLSGELYRPQKEGENFFRHLETEL